MTSDGVENQNLSLNWVISGPFEHIFSSVFNPIRNISKCILKAVALRFVPILVKRWRIEMFTERGKTILRVVCQCQNRNRVPFVEPKRNCSFELGNSDRPFSDWRGWHVQKDIKASRLASSQQARHNLMPQAGFEPAGGRFWRPLCMPVPPLGHHPFKNKNWLPSEPDNPYSDQCQNPTPFKKHIAKFKRLPTRTRLTVRNFSAPQNCVASYARLRNASEKSCNQRRESHPARSRSSNSESFSRFRAFSTLAGVSLTKYDFLPVGFRPAFFRFPPHFFVDIILIYNIIIQDKSNAYA